MSKTGSSIPSSKSALQLSSTQRPIQNIGSNKAPDKNDQSTDEDPPMLSVEADAEMASEILSPRPPPDDIAPDELALFVATGGNTAHSSKRSSVVLSHLTHSLVCQNENVISSKPKIASDAPRLWKRMFCCMSPHSDYGNAVGRGRYICSCFMLSHEESKAVHKLEKESDPISLTDGVDSSQPCITSPMPGNTGKESQILSVTAVKEPSNGMASATPLLPPVLPDDKIKKCFVIDLDETLVHSSFTLVHKADFKVGVDIDGRVHQVYVLKRPYVDMFLQRLGPLYECVLFTASLAKYADPVTDFIDPSHYFRHRLFRDSCCFYNGNYVKDLSMLGRDVDQTVILDNSPVSYLFHNANAVHILSWFDNPTDRALFDLIPYFEQLAKAPNVPDFLANHAPPVSATGSSPLNRPASLANSLRAAAAAPHGHTGSQPRPLNYMHMLRNSAPVVSQGSSNVENPVSSSSTNPSGSGSGSSSGVDRRNVTMANSQHDTNFITQVKKPQ